MIGLANSSLAFSKQRKDVIGYSKQRKNVIGLANSSLAFSKQRKNVIGYSEQRKDVIGLANSSHSSLIDFSEQENEDNRITEIGCCVWDKKFKYFTSALKLHACRFQGKPGQSETK